MSYLFLVEYFVFVFWFVWLSYNGLVKIDLFVFENIGSKYIYFWIKYWWMIELVFVDWIGVFLRIKFVVLFGGWLYGKMWFELIFILVVGK